ALGSDGAGWQAGSLRAHGRGWRAGSVAGAAATLAGLRQRGGDPRHGEQRQCHLQGLAAASHALVCSRPAGKGLLSRDCWLNWAMCIVLHISYCYMIGSRLWGRRGLERDSRKIVRRLEAEGWVLVKTSGSH